MTAPDISQVVVNFFSSSEVTMEAFRLPHNEKFLVEEEPEVVPDSITSDGPVVPHRRKISPLRPPPILYLQIRLDAPPKDVTRGWIFGSDAKTCDVLLDKDNGRGVSHNHFGLSFNWKTGYLMLYNMSHGGTVLGEDTSRVTLRRSEKAVLDRDDKNFVKLGGYISMVALIPNLQGEKLKAYKISWDIYRRQALNEAPGLEQMQLSAPFIQTTPRVVQGENSDRAYWLKAVIGSGTFGTVHLALRKDTGNLYALKTFTPARQGQHFVPSQEIELYKKIEHCRIVKFVEAFHDISGPVLVMEWLANGSLSQQHQQSPVTMAENYTLIHQVLEALLYLHSKDIAHRDLKPANILVCARMPGLIVKVADFGISTEVASDYLKTICGTRVYCAPELWLGSYNRKVDIWALGVIGLQYLAGLPPFPPAREEFPWKMWVNKIRQLVEEQSDEQDGGFKEGLRCMLKLDPTDRPSAAHCIEREWFQVTTPEQLEIARGPPPTGLVPNNPRIQPNNGPRSWFVGASSGSDAAAEHDQPTIHKERASKRLKKA